MATTCQPPEIRVIIFTEFRKLFGWSCPPLYHIEGLKMETAAILLPLDLESDRMVLRKRGKQQPLRDSPTLSSYDIIDGSALELEAIGCKPE